MPRTQQPSLVTSENFAQRATKWLRDQKYDVIMTNSEKSHSDFSTWRKTAIRFGLSSGKAALSPHSAPFGLAKAVFVAGNRIQANPKHLEQALAPYAQQSTALGLKLGRLTQGNTRVVAFVPADDLGDGDLKLTLDGWSAASSGLQKIGRAPGQTYGEIVMGLYTAGLTGFRIQQPVEVYPLLVFFDPDRFETAKSSLLAQSVREVYHRRDSLQRFVTPTAPSYLQAILVCVPTNAVAALDGAKETRRAWKHYKKPKLAERIFTEKDLVKLVSR